MSGSCARRPAGRRPPLPAAPGGPAGPDLPPGWGPPIITVEAVTVPSLFFVPCTPMKSPTLSADSLDVVDAPFGPDRVLKVVPAEVDDDGRRVVQRLHRDVVAAQCGDPPADHGRGGSAGESTRAPAGGWFDGPDVPDGPGVPAAPAADAPSPNTAANAPPATRAFRGVDHRQRASRRAPGSSVPALSARSCGGLLSLLLFIVVCAPASVCDPATCRVCTMRHRRVASLRGCWGPAQSCVAAIRCPRPQ